MVLPVPRTHPSSTSAQSPDASGSTWCSTPTPTRAELDLDRLDRAVRGPAPARCCSPSRTTRGDACSPAPSSRASVTSSLATAPGWSATRSTRRWCCPAPSTCPTWRSRAPRTTRSRWWPPEGVQHRRAALRADHRPRRRAPEGAAGRADGAQRLLVAARRGRGGRGVHARRPVAGGAGRAPRPAAHPARRAARRAPARGADAAARGHLPRLARPARLRPRRPGRGRAGRADGCGSRRATTTSRGSTATSG